MPTRVHPAKRLLRPQRFRVPATQSETTDAGSGGIAPPPPASRLVDRRESAFARQIGQPPVARLAVLRLVLQLVSPSSSPIHIENSCHKILSVHRHATRRNARFFHHQQNRNHREKYDSQHLEIVDKRHHCCLPLHGVVNHRLRL